MKFYRSSRLTLQILSTKFCHVHVLPRNGDSSILLPTENAADQQNNSICGQYGPSTSAPTDLKTQDGSRENSAHIVSIAPARLCCIEIQVRPNQDRGQFLALYLVRRANFWVSSVQKILFAYTKDAFCGSVRYRTCTIWFWFADPNFMYRAQPCAPVCSHFP